MTLETRGARRDAAMKLLTTVDTGFRAPGRAPAHASKYVGRYRLSRELGSGGMGVVYAARAPKLDRQVAVKLLRASWDKSRLEREARALAKLSHPNVISVYDVGEAEGQTFIAMELVEGCTLRAWLAANNRSLREVIEMLLHAGRGLAAAHSAGLVHRDFKPENIMVGRDGRARVLDFGIVAQSGPEAERIQGPRKDPAATPSDPDLRGSGNGLTGTGTRVGTPAYMAPEQLRAEQADERADQFAFCTVLWEAVHGNRPFQGERAQLLRRVRDLQPNPPANPRIAPPWLDRVMRRGLTVDPAQRHPSMTALLKAMEAGLAREAASAQRVGGRYEPIHALAAHSTEPIRAIDRLTCRVVDLRPVMLPASSANDTGARVDLVRRFRGLAALHHPNLVAILDFGFYASGAPYVVLEPGDSGVDLRSAAREHERELVLDYLVQLLRALSCLHRHNAPLGGLCPSEIRIISHQLKLSPLGMGLRPSGQSSIYSAPETHQGTPATIASDLYAFGALTADLLALDGLDEDSTADGREGTVDRKLRLVTARLQAPDPAARYATAEDVIAALSVCLGRPLATETLATRQTRLSAAPFLGRDAELSCLQAAVRATCDGRGSAWLVGGESGVGKSRLLDEVHTLAAAHGAIVLRGQEESEGGSASRAFLEALRSLTALSDIDDFEASVLVTAVPDLATRLGRTVTAAQPLDGPATRARLLRVVQDILRRQLHPVVLLLDDLQWTRSDSLQLLHGLLPLASEMRLLVIATYRDDERPGLKDLLPEMLALELQRLPREVIRDLASAIIGQPGRRKDVVELLHRESDGNPFFLVEVIRALCEEAGGVERIGSVPLPATVFPGGIRRLVQRRLRAVPEEARILLQLAAVVGRNIDERLLQALKPHEDMGAWQRTCIEAGTLQRAGTVLRFAHDKLREGLLSALSDNERTDLHAQVAAAIERLYPGDETRYGPLAFHFGRSMNADKEAYYSVRAGEVAVRQGAVHEGIELLERAHRHVARNDHSLPLAEVGVKLAGAYYYSADMSTALSLVRSSMQALRFSYPTGSMQRVAALCWHLSIHISHRIFPGLVGYRTPQRRAEARIASRAAEEAANISISLANESNVLLFSLIALNLAERARHASLFASGLVGYSLACVGLHQIARSYFAAEAGDSDPRVRYFVITKASYLVGIGELAEAEALLDEDLKVIEATGFKTAESYNRFLHAYCAYYRGQLDSAAVDFARSLTQEDTRLNFTPSAAINACFRGRLGEAEALVRPALDPAVPASPRATAFGVLALIHVQRNAIPEAIEAARRAQDLRVKGHSFGYSGAGYFLGVAEAYLAELSRLPPGDGKRKQVLRQLRKILRRSRAWARAFRIGRPQTLLCEGRLELLLGRRPRAQAAFRQGLALAQDLGLDLYAALAHEALGRLEPQGSSTREHHLQAATVGFTAAGVEATFGTHEDLTPRYWRLLPARC